MFLHGDKIDCSSAPSITERCRMILRMKKPPNPIKIQRVCFHYHPHCAGLRTLYPCGAFQSDQFLLGLEGHYLYLALLLGMGRSASPGLEQLRCVEDLQTIQVIKILKYEKKVAKMCFSMVFVFLTCWMPYIVTRFLVVNGYGHLVTPTVSIVSYLFAKSSTVYNPVIYIFMIRKFRRSLLQLLCCRLLRCQRPAKNLPAAESEMQIRPIVMSQKDGDRPKKKVTFNSSSIIFIITSDESLSVDDSDRSNASKANVIQVRPL
nr:opsin-3 isoform X1 [Peromyscus maniculatus bairdii]